MNKLHPIIRWIIFIPASFLAAVVTDNFILFAHNFYPGGGIATYFNQIIAAGLSGTATIYVAYYIAPDFKKRVVIGYAIFTFLFLLITLAIVPSSYFGGVMESLRYAAYNIAFFVMGWYLYEEEKRKEKLTL